MPWDIHPHYHVRDKSQVQGLFKGNKTILKSWFNKCTGWILSTHNKKSKWKAGHNPLLILLFSLFRNGTGNDASIIPLEIRLAIKGLLILLTGTTTASMNQIWFTHQQAPHRLETLTYFLYFNHYGNCSTLHTIYISSLWVQSTVNSNYKGRSRGHLAHWDAKGKFG